MSMPWKLPQPTPMLNQLFPASDRQSTLLPREAGQAAFTLVEEDECSSVAESSVSEPPENESLDEFVQISRTVTTNAESYRTLEILNRNAVVKLRDQAKLIERLKSEKVELEERVRGLQQDVQLKQQMGHSIALAKRGPERNLPQLDTGRNEGISIPRSPARPHSTPSSSPRGASPRAVMSPDRSAAMTPPELREVQGLRLKVHHLETEKKKRNDEFAAQLKIYARKVQKLEQELAELDARLRERDTQIRMLEIRAQHQSQELRGNLASPRMLTDAIWGNVVPLKTHVEPVHAKSDVGVAFDELLTNELLDTLQNLPGHYTNQWLHEVKETATKLAVVHAGFKALAGSFQRVAASTSLYDLVHLMSTEALALVGAEEAFVFVVDQFQKNELWCRTMRGDGELVTSRFQIPPVSVALQSSYNEYMAQQPVKHAHPKPTTPAIPGRTEYHRAEAFVRASVPAVVLPHALLHTAPGFVPYAYHTRETLNIPGCKIASHPLYSGDSMSTDRLIKLKSSATLLLPICSADSLEPIAILQVCGKTRTFRGMGIEVEVENCRPFSHEDQLLLAGFANFCGGMLKKVMSFAELETNRRSECELLSLSRQIFTCLDFKKLSMLVMKSTKDLLDTDRCTLFVTKMTSPTETVLSAWQSDMGTGSIDFHKGTEIVVRFGEGIAGACAELRSLVNVPDAYEDKRFNRAYDEKTKYRTKSILAAPILSSKSTLLGVIQMINKSGGTPFRAKDEEHLVVVAQLIALAMENSNLFQKTQDVSRCIGTYIRHLHLNEALLNLSAAAEDIVGVQGATIYLVDERTNELFTFHKVRKTRIDIRPGSIMEEAMSKRTVVIVNNTGMCLHYNPAIDAINGIAAHQVMFVPLFQYGKNHFQDKIFIGLVHLINRKGTVHDFDEDDSLVAIVANQAAGILTSIMERQNNLQLHEDTKLLLETCMSFYKELNPLGVMNAVYNAATATFSIEKGHLWLLNEDKSSLWTPKLLPPEELKFANPSLLRRVSVSTKDRLEVPCIEGLLKRVVQEGRMICVRRWDLIGDATHIEGVQRITATDRAAGFTDFAITAAPVWDSFGIEVLGVLMLLYPRGRSLHRLELSKIPIFTRQITGALMVCREVARHLHHVRRLESMLRGYGHGDFPPPNTYSSLPGSPAHVAAHVFSLAIEIDAHGWLKSQSYPINLFSKTFSLKSRTELLRLPMDTVGNRHVMQVTNSPRAVFAKEHFDKWVGHEIAFGDWEKVKYDIHNALSRKETLSAYYGSSRSGRKITMAPRTTPLSTHLLGDESGRPLWDLSDHIRHEVASFLWLFCNKDLRIEWSQVFALFTPYDKEITGTVEPLHFEHVLKACGVHLNHHEHDALGKMFAVYAKPEKGQPVDMDGAYVILYRELFQSLAPGFIKHTQFDYEIFPTLNATTHAVSSIQLILSPTGAEFSTIATL